MVPSCAVVGCKSSWNPFTTVSFHNVTKNKKILPLWQRVVAIKPHTHAKICSLHFRPEDLVNYKDGKRLKPDAVPIVNVFRDEGDRDDSCEEDEEDNKNLSILKKLLTIDSNRVTAATQDNDDQSDDESDDEEEQPHKFEVVMSSCNSTTCNSVKAKTEKSKVSEMRSTGIQTNRTTDREIKLRQRVKQLGQTLRRRDAKISSMKTVFNMIKKNVKGTDMEYKLSCELQNISNFSEPIKSNAKKNTNIRPAKAESPVSDCFNDDEESSADENGMFIEVTLSPNLKPQNGVEM